MNQEKKYEFWLKSQIYLSNRKMCGLIDYFGDARTVFEAGASEYAKSCFLQEREIERMIHSKKGSDIDRSFDIMVSRQIRLITKEEPEYPKRLNKIVDAPYGLFCLGNLPKEDSMSVGIVGARVCSPYGKEIAKQIGKSLAACGVQIISGMANGIDSYAQWGAVYGNEPTYAVLGCGVDICYPQSARNLRSEILNSGGGILSEYPPNTQPLSFYFPARNRIISGLSDKLVVVEARKRSGSLITADCALEQGKDIYAVPGRMDDSLSEGCNALIKQGAGICLSVKDLLEELGVLERKTDRKQAKEKILLEKEESLVYSCFDLHAKSMEELIEKTGMKPMELADVLIRLQVRGLIEESFKNYYIKR